MEKELLILSGNQDTVSLANETAEELGLRVTVKKGIQQAVKAITGSEVILLDLPDAAGSLQELRAYYPEAVVVVMSEDYKGVKTSLEGVFHFIEKPYKTFHLGFALRNASRYLTLRNKIGSGIEPPRFIASSPGTIKILKQAERASARDVPVLISGEDGAGKGLLARLIHLTGPRRVSSFSVIDDPDELPKALESAGEGSIYLRKCKAEAVAKINGLLENPKGPRRGGPRLICGVEGPAEPTFKNHIKIPPLRERREDILPLAVHFLSHAVKGLCESKKELTKEAVRALRSHNWPGNVQELENAVRKACVLSKNSHIEAQHLCLLDDAPYMSIKEFLNEKLKRFIKPATGNSRLFDAVIAETEKSLIELALKETGGNQLKAAKTLGMNRNTLRAKIKSYKITKKL